MGTKSLAPTQTPLAPIARVVTKIVPHVPTTWAAPNVENQPTPDGAGMTVKNRISQLNYIKTGIKPLTTDSHSIHPSAVAFANSRASDHFLPTDSPCTNKHATNTGIPGQLPDSSIIRSTHTAILDIPALPIECRQAHIPPGLISSSLGGWISAYV
jgi:hypothetical protein